MSNLSFLFPLVSGLSSSKEVAQSQVSVGMGLLAGSTVLLLTIIWGTCVIVGKCDIEDSIAIDSQDTRGFSLTGMSFHIVQYLLFNFNKFGIYLSKLPLHKHLDNSLFSPSSLWSTSFLLNFCIKQLYVDYYIFVLEMS